MPGVPQLPPSRAASVPAQVLLCRPDPLGPTPAASGSAGRGGRRQPCSHRAGAWPAAFPSGPLPRSELHYLIRKPLRKGAAKPLGVGVRGAFLGPSWQPRVPDEGWRHTSGVCLPSDHWAGSWLLSAFWGDQARLKQAGCMALPIASWLPSGQRIYFRSWNRMAGQEKWPGAHKQQSPSPTPTPGLSFPSVQHPYPLSSCPPSLVATRSTGQKWARDHVPCCLLM